MICLISLCYDFNTLITVIQRFAQRNVDFTQFAIKFINILQNSNNTLYSAFYLPINSLTLSLTGTYLRIIYTMHLIGISAFSSLAK